MLPEIAVPYRIVETIECDIQDKKDWCRHWYMREKVHIISSGGKFGMVYDQNSRSYPIKPQRMMYLLDCKWDFLTVLDTECGSFVVALSNEKYSMFHLLADKEIIEETEKVHKNIFCITAKRILNYQAEKAKHKKW